MNSSCRSGDGTTQRPFDFRIHKPPATGGVLPQLVLPPSVGQLSFRPSRSFTHPFDKTKKTSAGGAMVRAPFGQRPSRHRRWATALHAGVLALETDSAARAAHPLAFWACGPKRVVPAWVLRADVAAIFVGHSISITDLMNSAASGGTIALP